MFLAKDFIETKEGLVFAVVESGTEQGKVLCFLRYIQSNEQWQKVDTKTANQFLAKQFPHYLYFSPAKQAHLHAVALDAIFWHHQPRIKLQTLLNQQTTDTVEDDLIALCYLFKKQGMNLDGIGITGSLLISAQTQYSDIDLVFYDRKVFHSARAMIAQLIQSGDCKVLAEDDWKASYQRRDCDLTYAEYVWHEKRKFNKIVIHQRKVDLSYVSDSVKQASESARQYKKMQEIHLKVKVTEDTLAFDYPASYLIDHPQIHSIVCYTATYTGQAEKGEWIEVAGLLEQDDTGVQRIVVGSSREARGQYIKVINGQKH